MQSLVDNCYNKASNNPDRFADCITNGQKKTSELNESFQFKMVFLTRSVQQCISNKQTMEKCENDAIKLGHSIIDNLLKQIDKI